jgi:hypothetical protein
MKAADLQQEIKEKLTAYFGNTVVVEWPISRGSSDAFSQSDSRYSPRVDVAVFTAGMTPGNYLEGIRYFWERKAPVKLKGKFDSLPCNENRRCALAIEVVHSGSPKYILGDLTDASMMGLYGVVVPSLGMELKVRSVWEYAKVLRAVGKAPDILFQNLLIIPQAEFIALITQPGQTCRLRLENGMNLKDAP